MAPRCACCLVVARGSSDERLCFVLEAAGAFCAGRPASAARSEGGPSHGARARVRRRRQLLTTYTGRELANRRSHPPSWRLSVAALRFYLLFVACCPPHIPMGSEDPQRGALECGEAQGGAKKMKVSAGGIQNEHREAGTLVRRAHKLTTATFGEPRLVAPACCRRRQRRLRPGYCRRLRRSGAQHACTGTCTLDRKGCLTRNRSPAPPGSLSSPRRFPSLRHLPYRQIVGF